MRSEQTGKRAKRSGVAVVEMAVLVPILLTVVIGIWELGRVIQVQQIISNAARDGARLAAQGSIINTTGAFTQIQFATGTPNVVDAAM